MTMVDAHRKMTLHKIISMAPAIADSVAMRFNCMASSKYKPSTSQATSPTTSTLAQDLISSTSEFMENIRFRPLSGFKRSNFGIMALPDNHQPPTPIGPKKAASNTIINQGVSAMVASQADA